MTFSIQLYQYFKLFEVVSQIVAKLGLRNFGNSRKRKGSLIERYGMGMEVEAGYRGVDGRYREV